MDYNALIDRTLTGQSPDEAKQDAGRQGHFSSLVQDAGLHFEGAAYPVSIRPFLVERAALSKVRAVAEWLIDALDVVARLYAKEPSVRALFPACTPMEEFIRDQASILPTALIARIDGLFDASGTYRLIETNTDCPGGIIQNGIAARLWLHQCDSRPTLVDDQQLPMTSDPNCFARALVEAYTAIRRVRPRTARIVNFRGRYTNEVDWMVASFKQLGLDCRLVEADSLRLKGDELVDNSGAVVDLTYNKYELRDLIGDASVRDYLIAGARGLTFFANPLMAQWVLADKAVFAVMTMPEYAEFFSAADHEFIRAHVPWTRLVGEQMTDPDGQRVGSQKFMLQRRKELVLKPVNGTRGEGVVIGCKTAASEWEQAVKRAMDTPHVVQHYVEPRTAVIQHPSSGRSRMVCGLDAYVFNGKLSGLQARASADPVMNIGRRGVLLPVITVR
jgi:diaminobutyrate-2-oxoglutarate transaminase